MCISRRFRLGGVALLSVVLLAAGWGMFLDHGRVSAQEEFTVEGEVVNSFTGNPVEGVAIEIAVDTDDKQLQVFTTGPDGIFAFTGLPGEGPYELGFSRSQYRSQELRGVSANEDPIEVQLVPRGISTPSAPNVTSSPRSVYVDWAPNPELNVKGYNVYRTEITEDGQEVETVKLNGTPGDVYSDLITGLEFTDNTVEKGVYYYYQVQAISGADRPSEWSEGTGPVKGQWLTIFIPDVARNNDGLYLWEREGQPGDHLVRIPVAFRSAYDVNMTASEIRMEVPADLFDDAPFQVETTGITAGMMTASNLQAATSIYGEDAVHEISIAGAEVEEITLYGAGELFSIYLSPKMVEEATCGLMNLIEDMFPVQEGVLIYSDPWDDPEEVELISGEYCTEQICIHGDTNQDGIVDAADAQHILDYRAGLVQPTTCYPEVWDINLDGRITAADATLIRRYVEGMSINPPADAKAESLMYESFAAAAAMSIIKSVETPFVTMPAVSANVGQTVEAPIYIEGAPQLAAVTLTINFDAAELEFVNAQLGAAFTAEYLMATNVEISGEQNEFGTVTISISGSESLGEMKSAVELAVLNFTRIGGTGGTIPAELVEAEVSDAYGHTPRHTDPMAPVIGEKEEPVMVDVPDVVDMSQAEAEAAITGAGLTVNVTTEHSDDVAEGDVISQSPEANVSVEVGSVVNLVVSLGPEDEEPVMVEVPDVVGMSQADAEAAIEAAGLTVGTVTEEHSDDVAEGDVISQNPEAGASVEEGSAVNLVVSKGEEETVRPIKQIFPICGAATGSTGNPAGSFVLLAGLGLLLAFRALRVRSLS